MDVDVDMVVQYNNTRQLLRFCRLCQCRGASTKKITGLTNGNEILVEVRTTNNQGESTSWSSQVSGKLGASAAPSKPSLTTGDGQITRWWHTHATSRHVTYTGHKRLVSDSDGPMPDIHFGHGEVGSVGCGHRSAHTHRRGGDQAVRLVQCHASFCELLPPPSGPPAFGDTQRSCSQRAHQATRCMLLPGFETPPYLLDRYRRHPWLHSRAPQTAQTSSRRPAS